jgi:hypothetical protein
VAVVKYKPRGTPDRRGMGAQSDFIAETFVPSEKYKAEQIARARSMIAAGVDPEQVARMFLVPLDLLTRQQE